MKAPSKKVIIGVTAAAAGAVVILWSSGALGALAGRGRVYVRDGQLHGPEGPYTLTQADLLWLARAVVGECSSSPTEDAAAAVIWALAQNFMLVIRQQPFSTFTALIRAYSHLLRAEGLNPGSNWCRANPDLCDPMRLGIRQRLQSMSWGQLPRVIQNVVNKFAAGRLHNPVPGCVDWANYRWQTGARNVGGNWFGVGSSRRLRP